MAIKGRRNAPNTAAPLAEFGLIERIIFNQAIRRIRNHGMNTFRFS